MNYQVQTNMPEIKDYIGWAVAIACMAVPLIIMFVAFLYRLMVKAVKTADEAKATAPAAKERTESIESDMKDLTNTVRRSGDNITARIDAFMASLLGKK